MASSVQRCTLAILFEAAAGILLMIAYTNIATGNQLNHLLKNLAIAGGALALFISGPGAQSLDAKRA